MPRPNPTPHLVSPSSPVHCRCSEERRELARRMLHSLAPRLRELLAGPRLEVQLRGLRYMNDDPSEVRRARPASGACKARLGQRARRTGHHVVRTPA